MFTHRLKILIYVQMVIIVPMANVLHIRLADVPVDDIILRLPIRHLSHLMMVIVMTDMTYIRVQATIYIHWLTVLYYARLGNILRMAHVRRTVQEHVLMVC